MDNHFWRWHTFENFMRRAYGGAKRNRLAPWTNGGVTADQMSAGLISALASYEASGNPDGADTFAMMTLRKVVPPSPRECPEVCVNSLSG